MEPIMLKSVYKEILSWKPKGCYPYLPVVESYVENFINFENHKPALMFGSCDYLGLAKKDYIIEQSIKAIREFGTNTYGGQMFCGYTTYHHKLEKGLAEIFKRKEGEAILFPSGTHANIGVISSIMGARDLIINDRLNHSSIVIGSKLSDAEKTYYDHNNMEKLEDILKTSENYRRKLIVVDGLFSADGDFARLEDICYLADKYDAMVMVDEAHSFGTCGENGGGLSEVANVLERVDIYVGTMSKALGSIGGFVIADSSIIDILRHFCSQYTSSRGSSPGVAAASVAALEILKNEGVNLRASLKKNTEYMHSILKEHDFNTGNSESHVIPIITGSNELTVKVANWLKNNGLFISAMIMPTVPLGKSRLRIGVSAKHTLSECSQAVDILNEARKKYGF